MMSVGLGNVELLNKEVQGDIDFDFFEAEHTSSESDLNDAKKGSKINHNSMNQNAHSNGEAVFQIGEKEGPERPKELNSEHYRECDTKEKLNPEPYNENEKDSSQTLMCGNLKGNFGINCCALKCYCAKDSEISSSLSSSDSESDITSVSPLSSEEESSEDELVGSNNLSQDSKDEVCDTPETISSDGCNEVRLKECVKFCDNLNGAVNENVEKLTNCSELSSSGDSTDLRLLVEAIKELERQCPQKARSCNSESTHKSLSFNNETAIKIEKENKRLLNKLVEIQKGEKKRISSSLKPQKLSSSTLNRQRQQKAIEQENLAILKRLKVTKPSKGITKDHLLKDYEKTRKFSISAESRMKSKSWQSTSLGSVASSFDQSRSATPLSTTGSSMYSRESQKSYAPRPVWNSRW